MLDNFHIATVVGAGIIAPFRDKLRSMLDIPIPIDWLVNLLRRRNR